MKIYLAEPNVSRPDVQEWADSVRAMCCRYGHEALTPVDHAETEAAKIFQAKLDMIRRSQVVLANLATFRGAEPDPGTCFEMGYALALGKTIGGYGWRSNYPDLPLINMLEITAVIVPGDLEDCLKQLDEQLREPATPAARLPDNPLARTAIEAAIRYQRWTTDGKIVDTNAIATIADQYKVSEEQVREWITLCSGMSLASNTPYRPDDITRQMKISGRQFRTLK